MKIIIVGAGKVGFTVAEQLVKEGHDITIIDTNDDVLRHAADALDIMCLKGNGASITTLREADVSGADLVISATSQDEINMICSLTSKRLGAAFTIARIRSVDYTAELDTLKNELGIDMVINPEQTTGAEISRLLRFPSAINIDTFYRGRVELMGFLLQENDFLCGQPLSAQSERLSNLPVLFCAVDRGDTVIIPNGSFVPQAGDMVYIIGEPVGLNQFFKLLGRYIPKIKNVIIIGGSRIAHYLTTNLLKMNMKVKIIERDRELSAHIAEVLPKATVICGDGTNQGLLESENIDNTDAFVALTDRDEDNLLIALYAAQRGVPKVVVKANHGNYDDIAHAVGLDTIISTKYVTAAQILQKVRGMENSKGSIMTALYKIANNRAEAMEFTANETTHNLHVPLKDLNIKKGILVALIVHRNRIIIPEGSSMIEVGDSVIVISSNHTVLDLNDIFSAIPKGGAAL